MDFATNVRAMRAAKKLTQKDLAQAVKVDRVTISNIERGKTSPSLALAAAIAHELGFSLGSLSD